jgi:hypothetical protein
MSLHCIYVCRFEADRDKGDFSDLPELHALSSGLKATCTAITAGVVTLHCLLLILPASYLALIYSVVDTW